MFNALKYIEELEKAGFTHEQAEVSMKLLVETMNENFATKADLKELGWNVKVELNNLETQIKSVETKLESKIQSLETKLDTSIKELEYKMVIKLGSMMVVSFGVITAVVRMMSVGH